MWHDADRNRLFFPQELRTHIAVAVKLSNIGRCQPVVRDGARRNLGRSLEVQRRRRTDSVPLSVKLVAPRSSWQDSISLPSSSTTSAERTTITSSYLPTIFARCGLVIINSLA